MAIKEQSEMVVLEDLVVLRLSDELVDLRMLDDLSDGIVRVDLFEIRTLSEIFK